MGPEADLVRVLNCLVAVPRVEVDGKVASWVCCVGIEVVFGEVQGQCYNPDEAASELQIGLPVGDECLLESWHGCAVPDPIVLGDMVTNFSRDFGQMVAVCGIELGLIMEDEVLLPV